MDKSTLKRLGFGFWLAFWLVFFAFSSLLLVSGIVLCIISFAPWFLSIAFAGVTGCCVACTGLSRFFLRTYKEVEQAEGDKLLTGRKKEIRIYSAKIDYFFHAIVGNKYYWLSLVIFGFGIIAIIVALLATGVGFGSAAAIAALVISIVSGGTLIILGSSMGLIPLFNLFYSSVKKGNLNRQLAKENTYREKCDEMRKKVKALNKNIFDKKISVEKAAYENYLEVLQVAIDLASEPVITSPFEEEEVSVLLQEREAIVSRELLDDKIVKRWDRMVNDLSQRKDVPSDYFEKAMKVSTKYFEKIAEDKGGGYAKLSDAHGEALQREVNAIDKEVEPVLQILKRDKFSAEELQKINNVTAPIERLWSKYKEGMPKDHCQLFCSFFQHPELRKRNDQLYQKIKTIVGNTDPDSSFNKERSFHKIKI